MSIYLPIVFCFDDNFAMPAYVAIKSLIDSSYDSTVHKIYCVVKDDLTQNNREKILGLEGEKCNIIFKLAPKNFENAHQHRGITEASYFRLMLHEIIREEDKIIYLDVDILVDGDLSSMFNRNLSNKYIAAVRNLYIHQVFEKLSKNFEYWDKFFSGCENKYFNAGVLLMNLKEIRDSQIWKDWLELACNYSFEFHDQDILNMTCINNMVYLPPKYNSTFAIRERSTGHLNLFKENELEERIVIYHFTSSKPWKAKYMIQSQVWWNYVRLNTDMYSYFLKKYKREVPLKKRVDKTLRKYVRNLSQTLKGIQ